ncbi:ABC transporter permease [Cellvibrio japonicus]|uniref:Putative ABC transporter, ATP-binding protein n=1 Tax=Cellvibrio japonicus (strain Ueda107) TaxID=498211 RepID=B3PEP9_CELJU|nr:ABC transporter permease [Cellvibrio japonicus]ACE83479.1 putative ABC transporter, ATP-binding protein [Cellvibrio japonicus Ueda107]QEI10788.1 ABC transporter permease [Cellvibrio japonicus]QEI14364.1 ABC transporter permease [Cellvibrio japonicus]QEI17942.1 ABC transporter permease [Cellvibrio japonicus]
MLIDTQKWQEIFSTLGRHKLRTALTAFGVFWGIFMLTVLLGAGKSLEEGVTSSFRMIPNSVWMWPQGKTQVAYRGMPVGRQISLDSDDIQAIRDNIPNVDKIYPENSVGVWNGVPVYTIYKDQNGAFAVKGTHAGMENMHMQKVTQGRYINLIDEKRRRKVAVIGQRIKELLFEPGQSPIGETITIAGISFQVVGVYKSSSTENVNVTQEEIVYIPNDTLRQAFNQKGWISSFGVIPKQGVHAVVVENEIRDFLYQRKRISPDDKGILGSFNLQTEFEKVYGLFYGIQVFSWIVAIGTIMAGAIGVGNIMLIAVKERTREIGLRKALGATPFSIVAMIVQESVLITAFAGYLGLVAGVLILEAVNHVIAGAGGRIGMFGYSDIDFATALSALAVLVISGLLASLLPAAKAASVNPIVALQDE